jgi:hypothetical protein
MTIFKTYAAPTFGAQANIGYLRMIAPPPLKLNSPQEVVSIVSGEDKMKLALIVISVGLYMFAVVACNRPAAATSDASQNVAVAQPVGEEHANHKHAAAKPNETGTQSIAITVGEDGFAPNHVEVQRGTKATLRFTRTTDKTCATAVAFPELGLNKPLPLNQTVDIEIPADKERTLTFQCGMGMYKSKIVVL